MGNKNLIYLAIILSYLFASCYVGVCGFNIELDAKGIPITNYSYISPKGECSITEKEGYDYVGKQRNPLTISSYGIAYYNKYLGGNSSCKYFFLNCADWFVDNAVKRNGTLVWEYNFSWPTYNNTPHFISGIAQSGAIRVLAMAYNITGDQKYLQIARGGLESFFNEIGQGGVTYKDPEGWWYEEYAQPSLGIEPRVLNGHMIALRDLQEYYNLTRDDKAIELFNLGVSDLRAHLKSYDTGNWSRYDLAGNDASIGYHELHIDLLAETYNITGDIYFKNYRNIFIYYELAMLQKSILESDEEIAALRLNQSKLNRKLSELE
jgi:heparosan-N-sulfate-glucuronate 5-epimerase